MNNEQILNTIENELNEASHKEILVENSLNDLKKFCDFNGLMDEEILMLMLNV